MSSEAFHEPLDQLSEPTRDLHRAIVSLIEELEAVDWYQQRAEAAHDADLAAILRHNRDEEIEHAMMVLEWIRRREPVLAARARRYLFAEGPITALEHGEDAGEDDAAGGLASARGSASLGIGSLKGHGSARMTPWTS